jgi:transcriptional regulator
MTNIKDLNAEQKARVEKALASAEKKVAAAQANPTAAEVKTMVNTPAPKPATVVKKAPAKKAAPKASAPAKPAEVPEVGDDFVDSIKVITVLGPSIDAEIITGPTPYTKAKAENLDKRITATVDKIADNFDVLEGLVKEAKEGQIHIALGFASWTAYFAARINTKFAEITDRQVAALMLHEEGMSNRAIGSTLGVSAATVVSDVRTAKAKRPAATAPATPKKSVGKDGKEYTRTAPKPVAKKPAPKPEPKPTPKLSALEIRTDLALAAAENLVEDMQALIEALETLYTTPEFKTGGDKEIQAQITKVRKALSILPKAPARPKTATSKGA